MINAKETANHWAHHPFFDRETQTEALRIMEDEQRLLHCFGEELTFGTGGLRGILGVGTNRMNRYTVARATQGLADFLGEKSLPVAIGYDTRHGSREFAEVTAGVLAENGLQAYLFDRPLPTPILSFAVRELGCAVGVMITASHNPAEYNGYKVYGSDGCQITDKAAQAVMERIERVEYEKTRWMGVDQARQKQLLLDVPGWVYKAYLDHTLACRLFPQGDAAGIKVVYTALNGTGTQPVSEALTAMPGVILVQVSEQCLPDGNFPTCPQPNPELPQALELALKAARAEQAELVLATDPDCDRVGVAVSKTNGEYHILTGNEVGLLIMDYVLGTRAKSGTLPENPLVIKTIVTSDLAFPIAQAHGAEVAEVLTGFKYIGERIGELEQSGQESRYVFGFEESCGYLAGTHVRDKDGVMACVLVTEMIQQYKAHGITLEQALDKLYRTYGTLESVLKTYEITGALPMVAMDRTMKRLREKPPLFLAGDRITTLRDYLPGIQGLPPSNVLSYATDTGAKAIIRPSGTEPKVKVYLFVRAANRPTAQDMLAQMVRETGEWLALE